MQNLKQIRKHFLRGNFVPPVGYSKYSDKADLTARVEIEVRLRTSGKFKKISEIPGAMDEFPVA